MTNIEPIRELPADIDSWKGYRRILDIIVDSVEDEIMNLVEFLNKERGIIPPENGYMNPEGDDWYEKYEEPVEELIWKKISESLNPLPDQERI